MTASGNLAGSLLSWYDENRRILPWREDPTPYHVWISEIMLQQTRVEAVREYYARFLRAFPDIPALARADETEVLKLWEGLGYYSRGRNLHRAVQVIMERCSGEMPDSRGELLKLPGIGDYTASAIASIAFGERTPAVDGNLLRVFARMTCCGDVLHSGAAKKRAGAYYLAMMPADRPGDFNQALMDLGSAVCLAHGTPDCGRCPWQFSCEARQKGVQEQFPVRTLRKARRVEKRTVLVIRSGRAVLLDRRPETGLLAGLFELPNCEGWLDMAGAGEAAASLFPACSARGGEESPVRVLRKLGGAKHIFSHLEWHMIGYEVLAKAGDAGKAPDGFLWASPEEIREKYSIPSAFDAYRKWL
jgi:A/G-specific adenine glycosylase